ncbi:hypothetical protein BH09MYX1_BH09MYX1_03550 [soil metagenome]
MSRRRTFAFASALVVGLVASTANAGDDACKASYDEGSANFAAGKSLLDAGGDVTEAKAKLSHARDVWVEMRTSCEEWPLLPKVYYGLGLAYAALGDVTEAMTYFELFARSVDHLPDPSLVPAEYRRQALVMVSQLRLANGQITIKPALFPVRVAIDGVDAGPAPLTRLVPPGRHTVKLDHGEPRISEVTVRAGELEVIMPHEPPPPPAKPVVTYGSAVGLGWVITAGAIAIASVALPTALGFRANGLRSDASAERGSLEYDAAYDRFAASRTLYEVSYAVPAVLLATTAVLFAVHLATRRIPLDVVMTPQTVGP